MARDNLSQQNIRSSKNPFKLGSFSTTSLRYITGKLGPKNEVISGGYGNGEYNHWFQIDLESPAWIITIKAGPRPKYINVSAYDLNKTPIEGRNIFDADSVNLDGIASMFYPYLDTVMGAQSDIVNTFNRIRLDQGDERYFPLEKGSYLICVSSTRNEQIDYGVGIVVEFPTTFVLLALEDGDGSLLYNENTISLTNTILLDCPISTDTVIPSDKNAFSFTPCQINSGISLTINNLSTWLVDTVFDDDGSVITITSEIFFALEPGNDLYYDTIHDHTLSEWSDAWKRDNHADVHLPDIFIPFTTPG